MIECVTTTSNNSLLLCLRHMGGDAIGPLSSTTCQILPHRQASEGGRLKLFRFMSILAAACPARMDGAGPLSRARALPPTCLIWQLHALFSERISFKSTLYSSSYCLLVLVSLCPLYVQGENPPRTGDSPEKSLEYYWLTPDVTPDVFFFLDFLTDDLRPSKEVLSSIVVASKQKRKLADSQFSSSTL